MKIKNLFLLWGGAALAALLLGSCGPLRTPTVIKNAPIENYRYAYVTETQALTSSTGHSNGNGGGFMGLFSGGTDITTKTVNPGDVISGELAKYGFVILPELTPEQEAQTVIVNYGESGSRKRGIKEATEVTIQFISADSKQLICSCTAEGQGQTEADNIREAIRRALSALFAQ